jgi:hypothetical protein
MGYRSQCDIPGLLLGADVLMVIMPEPDKEVGSATISLKTYGYLRSGRPIVFIGPDGANWDMLRQFPGTYRCEHGAWDEVAVKVRGLCRQREDWTGARLDRIKAFSWQMLAGRIAAVFDIASVDAGSSPEGERPLGLLGSPTIARSSSRS